MKKIEFTAVQPELIPIVAAKLCKEDLTELERSGWQDAASAIRDSVEASCEAFMVWWDGEVQGVFGIAEWYGRKPESVSRVGCPWLLSAHPPAHVRREFMRLSTYVAARWNRVFPAMFNAVDAEHTRAQRWVMSMGLRPFAVQQRSGFPFIEFGVFTCAPQQ